MNNTFGDQLVGLWTDHKKRGERAPEWKSNEKLFRYNLGEAAQYMFGGLSALLEWSVKESFGGQLEARAEIPGYTTTLSWAPDITGLYLFWAWTRDPDGGVSKHPVDGRLKLGAILSEEKPYEADGPLGIGSNGEDG